MAKLDSLIKYLQSEITRINAERLEADEQIKELQFKFQHLHNPNQLALFTTHWKMSSQLEIDIQDELAFLRRLKLNLYDELSEREDELVEVQKRWEEEGVVRWLS